MEAEEPNTATDLWLYFKLLTYFRIRKIVLIVFHDISQWTSLQRWDKFSNECCAEKYCSAERCVLTCLFSWRLDCKLKILQFCLWWVVHPLDCFSGQWNTAKVRFQLKSLKIVQKVLWMCSVWKQDNHHWLFAIEQLFPWCYMAGTFSPLSLVCLLLL